MKNFVGLLLVVVVVVGVIGTSVACPTTTTPVPSSNVTVTTAGSAPPTNLNGTVPLGINSTQTDPSKIGKDREGRLIGGAFIAGPNGVHAIGVKDGAVAIIR